MRDEKKRKTQRERLVELAISFMESRKLAIEEDEDEYEDERAFDEALEEWHDLAGAAWNEALEQTGRVLPE